MPGSAAYIAAQRTLINNGNFMSAVAIDVHAKFGSKYDSALLQMTRSVPQEIWFGELAWQTSNGRFSRSSVSAR